MNQKLRRHRSRRVTDEQIRLLKAWMPLHELARAIGISPKHACAIRNGRVHYKSASP